MDEDDIQTRSSKESPGPDYPSVEYFVPLSVGGKDHPSNLVLVHVRCNRGRNRGDRPSSKGETLMRPTKEFAS